jgi:hypothetical protein
MTIHWKALEEHFLMISFSIRLFGGEMYFINISAKESSRSDWGANHVTNGNTA